MKEDNQTHKRFDQPAFPDNHTVEENSGTNYSNEETEETKLVPSRREVGRTRTVKEMTEEHEEQKKKEAQFKQQYEEKRQKRVKGIEEYLDSKLGKEPTVSGSARRWHFLRSLAKHIAYEGTTDFGMLRHWVARNLQVMQDRTLREGYLTYLSDLGIISYDLNNHVINWKGNPPV